MPPTTNPFAEWIEDLENEGARSREGAEKYLNYFLGIQTVELNLIGKLKNKELDKMKAERLRIEEFSRERRTTDRNAEIRRLENELKQLKSLDERSNDIVGFWARQETRSLFAHIEGVAAALRRVVLWGHARGEVQLRPEEYLTRLRLRPTSVYASGFGVGWRTSTLSRNDPTLLAKRDPPSVLPRGKASLDLASFGRLAGPVKASLRRFAALTGPASRPEWPGIEECQADAGGSI
jgi:hypothetical protein